MITFRDKHSGYEVKGLLFKKTDDCYAVADNDGIKLLRSDDWEEVRDDSHERRVQDEDASEISTEKEKA